MLKFAIVQINPIMGDFEANKIKILEYIQKSKAQNADVVIFPECIVCGYPPEDLLFKPSFIAKNIQTINEIAKTVKNITVILGFVDENKDKIYNALAVIRNGKIVHKYYKRKLPNYGVFDEKRYFTEGKAPLIINLNKIKCAMSICEDIWTDDTISEDTKNVDLIINISASPYHFGKKHTRKSVLEKYSKKASADILYCNLVGGQDELVFDGNSFVLSKNGKILKHAKAFTENFLIWEYGSSSPANEEDYDDEDYNVGLSDNPADISSILDFTSLHEVYNALVLGTRDYVFKNGFRKVLIGLSGGIDSALVSKVAVDALGSDMITCISMPSIYSSDETKSDARVLAKNLGVEFHEIPIENVHKTYSDLFADIFKGLKEDTTEENIQARIRGNILMAMSNKFGALVLTTGNKSEFATGYCTLYGDMAGGFAVIKDIPKTMVFELCKLHKVIPSSIIKRPPSAELRPEQKDQDYLPPYEILDAILELYIEKDVPLANIAEKLKIDHEIIKSVVQLVDLNEYKRRQAPVGIKITPRAFGRDRRMPIVNHFRDKSF